MSKEFINPEGLSVFLERYGGVTEHSKAYYLEHKDKIGDLLGMICIPKGDCEWLTYVIGGLGYIQMDGFSFGYHGEGRRGLEWLIKEVNGYDTENDIGLQFKLDGDWEADYIAAITKIVANSEYHRRQWDDLCRRYAH